MPQNRLALLYHALDIMQRVVELVFAVLLFLLIAYFTVSLAPQISHVTGIAQLHRYGDPVILRATNWLNAQPVRQYVPLVIAFAVYILSILVARLFELAKQAIRPLIPRKPHTPVLALNADSEEARDELYRRYREIERALKEAKRKRCTFLSVDVAGSSQMKDGESEIAITSSFRAFEEMLKRQFSLTRAWKQAWTPDGVMVCFLTRENAVKAAQYVLEDLPAFNLRENQLKTPFAVRLGISEGEVSIFEDTNLEKVVDHVIDVAAHMQKNANLNSVRLSADLCHALEDRSGFQSTGKKVDGTPTFEWRI